MSAQVTNRLFMANQCDPLRPATTEQYVEFGKLVGRREFIDRLRNEVTQSQLSGIYARYLFSGHVGSGKSSELYQLKTEFEQGEDRILAVIVDAKDFVNDYDADMTDILLGIVAEFGTSLPPQVSKQLKDSYFSNLLKEVRNLLTSTVQPKETEFSVGIMKQTFTVLPNDEQARQKVRQAVKSQGPRLLDEINLLFQDARKHLQNAGYRDFVIVVDNLEKVRRFDGSEELDAQQKLFIENSRDFTSLQTNLVLTVPLGLLRRQVGALQGAYGQTSHVLPMVKVVDRKGDRFEDGFEAMRLVIAKRCRDEDWTKTFTPDALDLLIQYTGGDIRQFIQFVRQAALVGNGELITLQDAQIPIQDWVTALGPAIGPSYRERLTAIHKSQEVDVSNPLDVSLLEQLYVLEYVNGTPHGTPFARKTGTWYVAHPILKELYLTKNG